jgi:hypothetical protein
MTREVHATLSSGGVIGEATPVLPAPAQEYHERFELHERRVLNAVADPSYETVAAALAVDPILAPGTGSTLAEALWAFHVRPTAGMSHDLS